MNFGFTKRDLRLLETIEQSWSGDELKINEENIRVWLIHPDNSKYDGDYQVEIHVDGTWRVASFSW